MGPGRTALRKRRHLSAVALLVAATLAAGCKTPPSQPASAAPADTVASPVSTLSAGQLEEARRFRNDFGLRSDDGWIATVARDPASDRTTYGVPLTAGEVDELGRRTRDTEQIKDVVISYGSAHPEDWGGAYIDQQAGGVLVALFTKNLAQHRLALLAQVWPKAKLDIRQVRWTQAELEATADRMRGDAGWYATIPAVVRSLGIDVVGNRVAAELSSPNPRASDLVLEHYGLAPDLLDVSSDGTGALLLDPGTVNVMVVDSSGRPVQGVGCAAYPDLAGASDPHPDPMPVTNGAGTCHLDVRATGYWIEIERMTQPPQVIAVARVVVAPGETQEIRVIAPR